MLTRLMALLLGTLALPLLPGCAPYRAPAPPQGRAVAPSSTRRPLATGVVPTGGYDCNVHFARQITQDADPGDSTGISYRQACLNPLYDAAGEWPICVCNNTGSVSSRPSVSECPAGYTEVGRCKRSSDYYQTCSTCSAKGVCQTPHQCRGGCGDRGSFCAKVAHSFVPTPAQCDVSAHDVLSAVEGCKTLCDRYFHDRYFDQSDRSSDEAGRWKLGRHAKIPDLGEFNDSLTKCRKNCGPPASGPFTELDNHWHWVTFNRWNPNENLDGWLRSYTVNKDKRYAPAAKCQELVNAYCKDPRVTWADGQKPPMPNLDARRKQCQRNLLLWPSPAGTNPSAVDFRAKTTVDFNNENVLDVSDDGFCDYFRHGNYLATETCYQIGSGDTNYAHLCGTRDPVKGGCGDLGGTCGKCSATAATCGGPINAYSPASIVVPAKENTCERPTVVNGGAAEIHAVFGSVPVAQTVVATWENKTSGCSLCSGPLVVPPSTASDAESPCGSVPRDRCWQSADADGHPIPVPLVTGTVNTIRVKFVDDRLRVSGDVVAIEPRAGDVQQSEGR